MAVAGDVAGAAGAGAERLRSPRHRRQHRRVLPHAEIVVRAPHRDLGADAVIEGARKAAAAPLEIGEHAIPPLGAQRIEALFEKAFVIHRRRRRQGRCKHSTDASSAAQARGARRQPSRCWLFLGEQTKLARAGSSSGQYCRYQSVSTGSAVGIGGAFLLRLLAHLGEGGDHRVVADRDARAGRLARLARCAPSSDTGREGAAGERRGGDSSARTPARALMPPRRAPARRKPRRPAAWRRRPIGPTSWMPVGRPIVAPDRRQRHARHAEQRPHPVEHRVAGIAEPRAAPRRARPAPASHRTAPKNSPSRTAPPRSAASAASYASAPTVMPGIEQLRQRAATARRCADAAHAPGRGPARTT